MPPGPAHRTLLPSWAFLFLLYWALPYNWVGTSICEMPRLVTLKAKTPFLPAVCCQMSRPFAIFTLPGFLVNNVFCTGSTRPFPKFVHGRHRDFSSSLRGDFPRWNGSGLRGCLTLLDGLQGGQEINNFLLLYYSGLMSELDVHFLTCSRLQSVHKSGPY